MSARILCSTYPNRQAAEKAARRFVTQRRAACANMMAVRSIYRWKGKVEEADEWLVLLKTTDRGLRGLRQSLLKSHPYDVPEAVVLRPSAVNRSYLQWLHSSVT